MKIFLIQLRYQNYYLIMSHSILSKIVRSQHLFHKTKKLRQRSTQKIIKIQNLCKESQYVILTHFIFWKSYILFCSINEVYKMYTFLKRDQLQSHMLAQQALHPLRLLPSPILVLGDRIWPSHSLCGQLLIFQVLRLKVCTTIPS